MFFHFKAFLLSLVALLLFEVLIFREDLFLSVLAVGLLFNFVFVWFLVRYFRFLANPLVIIVGTIGLILLVDGFWQRQLVVLLSYASYYLSLLAFFRLKKYSCDQTAQGMVNWSSFVALFFCLSAVFGWYLNIHFFDYRQGVGLEYFLTAIAMLAVFSVASSSFSILIISHRLLSENSSCKSVQALTLSELKQSLWQALIMVFILFQLFFLMLLWPFNYLTTSAIFIIVYFALWDVARNFIQNKARILSFWKNFVLTVFLIILLMVSTSWQLIY